MSNLTPASIQKKVLNPKMLTIAAVILIVLALLFVATPLLRGSGALGNRGAFGNRTFTGNRTFNGGTGGNGFNFNGGTGTNGTGNNGTGGNGFTFNGGNGANGTGRTFGNRNSLLRLGFLSGITGIIVYAGMLILALIAAAGMLFTKAWGKVLGIILAVVYLLLGLLSLVPTLLFIAFGIRNPLTLILGIVHIVLAIAVIVFASIPARQPTATSLQSTPAAS